MSSGKGMNELMSSPKFQKMTENLMSNPEVREGGEEAQATEGAQGREEAVERRRMQDSGNGGREKVEDGMGRRGGGEERGVWDEGGAYPDEEDGSQPSSRLLILPLGRLTLQGEGGGGGGPGKGTNMMYVHSKDDQMAHA
eukprot:764313-Hanusia_phi.AAC.1